ncbi:MAG: ATP-binding protein [Myxococcales bacterium]|nr:ATP-binding protein [Myxococcales bacterium]
MPALPVHAATRAYQLVEVNRNWYGINALGQTDDGFLWVGTEVGLHRYDGAHFESFTSRSTQGGLGADEIRTLAAGKDGSLWVGLANGSVSQLTQGAWKSYGVVAPEAATAVTVAADGSVWVAFDRKLFFKTKDAAAFTPHARFEATVSKLVPGAGRDVWALAGARVFRIEAAVVRPEPAALTVRALAALEEKPPLIVDDRNQVVRLGDASRVLTHFPEASPPFDLAADSAGRVWFSAGGLVRGWDPRDGHSRPLGPLHRREPALLYVDRDDTVWVASGIALYRLARKPLEVYPGAKPDGIVFSVQEDAQGAIWYATMNGVVRVAHGETQAFTVHNDIPLDCVRSLWPRREGGLWLAGCGKGLALFDGRTFTLSPNPAGRDSFTRLVFESRDGTLWLAPQLGGLIQRRPGEEDHFVVEPPSHCRPTLSPGCPHAGSSLAETPDGAVWFATEGMGLYRIKEGQVQRFTPADGLPSLRLLSLYVDGLGVLWIGTKDAGLARLRAGAFERLDERKGLPTNSVNGIVEDGVGHVWLASPTGVYRLSRAQVDAAFAGLAHSLDHEAFGQAEGMASARTSERQLPAALRASDGRLWFPTHDGAVAFPTPAPPRMLPVTAPVIQVSVDEGPFVSVPPDGRVTVRQGPLTVKYVVPHLTASHRVRTSYRLAGYDAEWTTAGASNLVRYDRVPRGSFTFVLRASLGDDSSRTRAVSIGVRRKGWLDSPVSWMAGLALLTGAVFAVHRARLHRETSRFAAVLKERNRIARDLHDGLAQGFAAISYQLERVASRLGKDPQGAQQMLEKTHDLVTQCRLMARQTVWDLRLSGQDGEGDLKTALARLCDQATLASNAVVKFEAVGGTPRAANVPEVRDELVAIAREAVTNALVHGRARNVSVKLVRDHEQVRLRVNDDGAGFDPAEVARQGGAHFGLKGMEERATKLGARLHVKSAPGQGATLEVSLG